MTEESGHRRQYDVELGQLKVEVAAAHTRLDSIDGWMRTMSEDIKGLRKDISSGIQDAIRQQASPNKLFVSVNIGLLVVLLSIVTLVVTPVVTDVAEVKQEHSAHETEVSEALRTLTVDIHDHAEDGHPTAVLGLVGRVEKELAGRINQVDRAHKEEHEEQEQDIAELRERDATFENRMDLMNARLTATETEIRDLKQKIVDRTASRFHRKDYETLVEPRLRRIESVVFPGNGPAK